MGVDGRGRRWSGGGDFPGKGVFVAFGEILIGSATPAPAAERDCPDPGRSAGRGWTAAQGLYLT